MKLGLVYRDGYPAAPRPLNATVVQGCRPDFIAFEVASTDELRTRAGDVYRLHVRPNYVVPIERMSTGQMKAVGRALNEPAPGEASRRITIGSDPSGRWRDDPALFVANVARVAGELSAKKAVLGIGAAPRAWLRAVLDLLDQAPKFGTQIAGIQVGVFPAGRTRPFQAWRLAQDIHDAGLALHVETGWRLGVPVGRWAAFGARWRGELHPQDLLITARARDAWMRHAWTVWSELDAASVAFLGYVEDAGATEGAWNIVDQRQMPTPAWRELRVVSARA